MSQPSPTLQWPLVGGPLEVEQIDRLIRVTPVVSLLSSVGAAMVVWQYRDTASGAALVTWLLWFLAMSCARVISGVVYVRYPASPQAMPRWAVWGVVSVLIHGVQWGLLSVTVGLAGDAEGEAVLHTVLAAIAMGAAVHMSLMYRVLIGMVALVLGPLVLRDLLLGGAFHNLMAVMSFLIGVYTLLNARNQGRAFLEVMTQRRRNAELVAALRVENERSEAALRAAEEASAARTRFFAAANHDLRQPLHAMGLLAQTLQAQAAQGDIGQDEVREVAAHMVECVDGMAHVVDDLLEITRMDAGSLSPQRGYFALDGLLQECARPFGALARAKGLTLEVSEQRFTVRSDRALLSRVLSNLLSNAIRYTPSGRVRLRLQQDGERVALSVEDNGIGIAPEHLSHIFDEFYQVANPARDRRLGLGLGLATVKRLSDLLGLQVAVQSTPGQGSTFTLHLPLAGVDSAALQLNQPLPQALPAPLTGGRRVLVVEDDADSHEATLNLLLTWGCDAQAVPGAGEGEALLQAGWTPEALVVDLRLSDGASGIDAVARLRSRAGASAVHNGCADLPALIVTGDVGSPAMLAAQAAGLTVMVKPVKPAQLRAFLGQAFAVAARR